MDPATFDPYCRFWKPLGWSVAFPEGDFIRARTCILSRQPGRTIRLSVSHPARVAAFLAEIVEGGFVQKLLIISFYGFANDPQLSSDLLQEVVAQATMLGFPWTVFGDFQAPAHEMPAALILRTGAACNLDDAQAGFLPPTGPARVNRIDFGIGSREVHADRVLHSEGIGDHLAVGYGFQDFCEPPIVCVPPRATFLELTAEQVQERFDAAGFHQGFAAAHDVEAMWQCLSSAAEAALCGSSDRLPRHRFALKVRTRRQEHQAAVSSEPLELRRLRRLLRRLQHWIRHEHVWGLGGEVLRDLASLSSDCPELDSHA